MTHYRLVVGDVRATLATLAPGSVQTCVTSPPYWGLRDYGTADWDGGDAACEHRVGGQVQDRKAPGAIVSGQRPGVDASRCIDCGAARIDAQIGLEATPDAYVAQLVAVFAAVGRVLADDGTLWVNLGDSYAASAKGGGGTASTTIGGGAGQATNAGSLHDDRRFDLAAARLKPKDLCGIPWRVAFALQAAGWYLRADVIWSKPNPMPESVTDRPTKAHEYIFLLAKSARYYYNAEAIAEPATGREPGNVGHKYVDALEAGDGRMQTKAGLADVGARTSRNRRSVWTVGAQSYADAHFATYPEKLIEPCILAGSRRGDTVLDPFTGSGTTGVVAVGHGRDFVGCELNPAYVALARTRIGAVSPLFVAESA